MTRSEVRATARTKAGWSIGAAVLAAIVAAAAPAMAGERPAGHPAACPRLLTVMPPGGRAGSEFELMLTGELLGEVESLHFSRPGITAEQVLPAPARPDGAYKKTPLRRTPRLDARKFRVHVAADVTPGIYDVRVVNPFGVSNPRAFVVGDRAEALEKEPNDDDRTAQRVPSECTVSGTIATPVDVDYFRFAARKGKRVVVACLASSVDSRLPAAVELYDPSGKLLAANHGYRGTDAVVDMVPAADGEFLVRVFSYAYIEGSPEHFYRITITTAPWIDAVIPPVVEPGKATRVTVYGRNLPGGRIDPAAECYGVKLERLETTIEAPVEPAERGLVYGEYLPPKSAMVDGFEFRLRNEAGVSNGYLMGFARGSVVLDGRENSGPESAERVNLPCDIAGIVEEKRNRDWFSFIPEKNKPYVIEAWADRIASPVDLQLSIRNAKTGQVLRPADDEPNVLSRFQLPNWTSDPPAYRLMSPTGDEQRLVVEGVDADRQAGVRRLYHVTVEPEQPDFRLVVMGPCDQVPNSVAFDYPDAAPLRAGGTLGLWVYAIRRGGFTGEIQLSAAGLPAGVTCRDQIVGTGLTQGMLVLEAAADAQVWTGAIRITGTAQAGDATIAREARPAGVVWPALEPNYGMVSRMNRQTVLAVRDRRRLPFRLKAGAEWLRATRGKQVTMTVELERLWSDFKAPVTVTALNLPASVSVAAISLTPGKDRVEAVLSVKENAAPGRFGIVFQGVATVPYAADPTSGERPDNIGLLETSPPVVLEIEP